MTEYLHNTDIRDLFCVQFICCFFLRMEANCIESMQKALWNETRNIIQFLCTMFNAIQLIVDMKDILTTPLNRPDPHPFYKHKTRSRTHPTSCTPTQVMIQLIVRCFMYNLKMANIDGRNMQLYRSYSERTIRNIVVFLTIYICTNNLCLLLCFLDRAFS